MKHRKHLILFIVTVIILMSMIIFLIGNSFGFFRYVKKGETVNIITIRGIEVEILNAENKALLLENSYPISDSEGMSHTPFEFKMTNTSERHLTYSIRIDIDDDRMRQCVLDDQTPCLELSTNHIRYTYRKDDGSYIEPRNLGQDGNIITTGIIHGKESVVSSIILWIDSESGNEIMNHYFYGKVMITGEQVVTE